MNYVDELAAEYTEAYHDDPPDLEPRLQTCPAYQHQCRFVQEVRGIAECSLEECICCAPEPRHEMSDETKLHNVLNVLAGMVIREDLSRVDCGLPTHTRRSYHLRAAIVALQQIPR